MRFTGILAGICFATTVPSLNRLHVQLLSQVPSPYLPETGQETVLRLGIAPLAVADWLQVDADFAVFHAHKTHVMQESADRVCQCLPESQQAQQQFAEFLLHVLREHHASTHAIEGDTLRHLSTGQAWSWHETALHQTSRWIQEDICLLEPTGNDYILTAASVCSPSNWRLEDKIGRTLDLIHAPVPGYAEQLATRVNRLLAAIRPGKALLRYNWSLQRGNELLWRQDMTNDSASDGIYWRVERQSLLRIPGSEVIVFSIRIYLNALQQLVLLPHVRNNLRAILARLPPEQVAYKGLLDKILV